MKTKTKQKGKKRNVFVVTCIVAVGVIIYWAGMSQKSSDEPASSSVSQPAVRAATQPTVPPYYKSADAAGPYSRVISAAYFRRYPLVERAYKDAAEMPGVLVQQPCYCHCDSVGHRSLLDCYTSDHAAG